MQKSYFIYKNVSEKYRFFPKLELITQISRRQTALFIAEILKYGEDSVEITGSEQVDLAVVILPVSCLLPEG